MNVLRNVDDAKYTFIIGNSRVCFTNYELKKLKNLYNKVAFFDPNSDSCEPIGVKRMPVGWMIIEKKCKETENAPKLSYKNLINHPSYKVYTVDTNGPTV